jgi:N-formylglutamate amidohydrolase/predicted deacylase
MNTDRLNGHAMLALTGTPGATPLVLDSPHSGREMPADFGSIRSERELREGEDCFIDELWGAGARARGVPLLAARFPRTYLDVNRHADDIDPELLSAPWPKPIAASGKAAIGKALVWRTLGNGEPIYDRLLPPAEVQRRIDSCHAPYHAALQGLLAAARGRYGAVWHINCHSMGSTTSVDMEGVAGQPRADIVLGDRDGTTCDAAFTAFVRDFFAARGYDVRVNDPFKGVELVRAYSDPKAGRHSLQLEINKRLYMDEATLEKNAGFGRLQADLSALTDALLVWATDQAVPPVELSPPDLTRWRAGNSGTEGVWVFDSGVSGPNVLVQALTHGNEICGAYALDALLALMLDRRDGAPPWRPLCGRLTLAFGNLAAYDRFDRDDPFASRCVDEDFNRVWADEVLDGSGNSLEKRRARELRRFVDAADFVLDIHSMGEPCRPLMVCGKQDKNAAFARALGLPGDLLIDTGHPAGLRMIDRGGFGDPASPKKALLIECGQHWERAAADVANDALWRFLGLTGLASAADVQQRLRLPLPPLQRLVRVTEAVVARSADFRFLVPPIALSTIPKAGTPIARDGDHVFVTPYDDTVLVMPGTKNLRPGGTAVRLGRFEA